MLSYNLTSVSRHAVMRQKVHHTLSTLPHQVLAVGALWDDNAKNTKQTFRLAVARKRRPWFEGLWANAGEPVRLTPTWSSARPAATSWASGQKRSAYSVGNAAKSVEVVGAQGAIYSAAAHACSTGAAA
jgi:hypothetical protein